MKVVAKLQRYSTVRHSTQTAFLYIDDQFVNTQKVSALCSFWHHRSQDL